MPGRADITRLDLHKQQYAITLADQIHLAGVILFCHRRPISHLNSKTPLPKALGQCQLHTLGFCLNIGSAGIHSPQVIDGCRQVVLLRTNPRKLKAVSTDLVEGLLIQPRRWHPWLQFQLLR
ncbi:hypothetical protein FQZ97_830600 [compost metagenome]